MKKLVKYLLTLGVAAFSFASCQEEAQVVPVAYTISGDSAFANNKATVKVTADKAAPEDVTLEIRLDVTSTLPAENLEFPATVNVAKGDTEASATITLLNPNKLEAGDYTAIFSAVILGQGPVTEKISIKYSKSNLNGSWSVIGTINYSNWDKDIDMTEGDGGWYSASGIEAIDDNAEFKFRKDKDWKLAFGVPTKSTAPIGKEFEVVDTEEAPNIVLAKEGIYTVSVNPNHKVAKVERTGDVDYVYAFTGPEALAENAKGELKAACNRPVKSDVTVTITATENTFPEGKLTFPASLVIAQGAQEATGEIAVGALDYGEYKVVLKATIGETEVATLTYNITKAIPVMTLADLVALMPETNKAKADFECILNNVVVTYVSGSNIFLEDETAAMLLYKNIPGIAAGMKLSGHFVGKVQNYNKLPEISDLTFDQEEVTIEQGEAPAPTEMTIADINANFDKLISKRVKLVNVYAGGEIKAKGSYDIYQGESSIKFYTNVNLTNAIKKGSIMDLVAVVTPYNDDKQVKIFEEASITRTIQHMTMSDIQALCTSSTNANFAGVFDGLYVNYILGTEHIYLEDASGALRFWSSNGKTLKFSGEQHTLAVGDKISGVISGTCKLDSGRPTINWLDFSYASVVAAPADEQPKPVTGTLGSFTDVNGLMYRRVVLENVVLEADVVNNKSSQIVTVSDGTGTMPLHLRFKPSQAIPKGYKVSGIGTFDVNGGKLEIRVFSQSDVTGVTPPSE